MTCFIWNDGRIFPAPLYARFDNTGTCPPVMNAATNECHTVIRDILLVGGRFEECSTSICNKLA